MMTSPPPPARTVPSTHGPERPGSAALDSLSVSSLLSGDGEDEDGRRAEELGELEVNPYDGLPFSSRYYSLLEERRRRPVWSLRERLLEALEDHSMVLLSTPSGAGKSTQVPKHEQQRLRPPESGCNWGEGSYCCNNVVITAVVGTGGVGWGVQGSDTSVWRTEIICKEAGDGQTEVKVPLPLATVFVLACSSACPPAGPTVVRGVRPLHPLLPGRGLLLPAPPTGRRQLGSARGRRDGPQPGPGGGLQGPPRRRLHVRHPPQVRASSRATVAEVASP